MKLAIKIDVDTDRGTREGVIPLMKICSRHGAPATFLFSFGPDNTGKAIRRIFRPGFLKKVTRTNVAGNYGIRTLLNGTLLPAPMIAKRNGDVMRQVKSEGFATGIHCWDHFQWQDYLHRMPLERIRAEFKMAWDAHGEIFGEAPITAGAPGWQCSADSLKVYDEFKLLYGSDTRGDTPFLPALSGRVYSTLQIPTTLPTLDEWLGRPEYPIETINASLIKRLQTGGLHVHTIHAELEGLHYASLFDDFLARAKAEGVKFVSLEDEARKIVGGSEKPPVCEVVQGEIDGRSGLLALQGKNDSQ